MGDRMTILEVVYIFFGVFSLYATYAIIAGEWDFSAVFIPVGKSIGMFFGLP